MFALFPIFLLVIAIFTLPATSLLRKQKGTTWWDFTYPYTGVVAWIILSMFEVGATMSLSNLAIEVFWIVIASIPVPWVLWFISRLLKKQPKTLVLGLTMLPIIVAITLRLTMPTLPE